MRTGYIYGLHNGDGNIRYIGYTTRSLITRLNEHRNRAEAGKQRAASYQWMRKYGPKTIQIKALVTEERETVEELTVVLHELEKQYISEALEQGVDLMNTQPGGEGHYQTAEARAKIAAHVQANPPFKGRKHTEETRAKLREVRANQVFSEESLRKRGESIAGEKHPMYGKKHTPEALAKMRANSTHHAPWNKGLKNGAKHQPRVMSMTNHTRHHTNKNIVNPLCDKCTVGTQEVGQNVN